MCRQHQWWSVLMAAGLGGLVGVEGLVSYVTTFPRVFRHPVRIGHPGRLRLRCPSMRFSKFPRVVVADPSPPLDAQSRYPQRLV
jgi:hypothetical protein